MLAIHYFYSKAAGFYEPTDLDPETSISAGMFAGSIDLDDSVPLEKN